MEDFKLERDEHGNESISVPYKGHAVLTHNMYNRGTAFTYEERNVLGLTGLLPFHVSTIEEQSRRAFSSITRKTDSLERFIGLEALEARDATLFYRVISEHIEELLPIVYTPTVGLACQRFTHIFRRGRGLWITPEHKGRIRQVLDHAPYEDVRLIVVTDNERILGLGDLGAGGMGIPVGKLALYTVGAGFHPTKCLPISLDVGTDNVELLNDELYVGWRHKRLRGKEYDELVEEFVEAVKDRFPNALLQWEDFKKANAFRLLDRYRDRLCSFNDDIQGTAAVAVAGIMAAARATKTPLKDQRVVLLGAGAAGVGIARLFRDCLKQEGVDEKDTLRSIALLDSRGLLLEGREIDDDHKREFVWPKELASSIGLSTEKPAQLLEFVKAFKPTVLIGTSGQPKVFDKEIISAMAAGTERPAIFPFSNPNSQSEAIPADVIEWTKGKALIATGSPFDPVHYDNRIIPISQGNNVYIFPGVGLGAVVAGASKVTDGMFRASAYTLAKLVEGGDLEAGALYPSLSQLRRISAEIAVAVGRTACEEGVAAETDEETLRRKVHEFMWYPSYPKLRL